MTLNGQIGLQTENKGVVYSTEHLIVPFASGKTYEEFYGEEKAKKLKRQHSKVLKGRKRSKEVCINISKGKLGKKNHKLSQTLKERGTHKGESNYMFGKHHSEETKRKISLSIRKSKNV